MTGHRFPGKQKTGYKNVVVGGLGERRCGGFGRLISRRLSLATTLAAGATMASSATLPSTTSRATLPSTTSCAALSSTTFMTTLSRTTLTRVPALARFALATFLAALGDVLRGDRGLLRSHGRRDYCRQVSGGAF